MRKENLVNRISLKSQSSYDCAMNCINSTKYSKSNDDFECNIYFYDPHSRACVLYEYDFESDSSLSDSSSDSSSSFEVPNHRRRSNSFRTEAFDYFIDECEMDELIGDIVGYSKYCRRILGKMKKIYFLDFLNFIYFVLF
jgi:cAMP phosphodiesterase